MDTIPVVPGIQWPLKKPVQMRLETFREHGFSDIRERRAAAFHIVSEFDDKICIDLYPPGDVGRIFGIEKHDTEPPSLSQTPLGCLVFNCWACLRKFHSQTITKHGVWAAVLQGQLPEYFQHWVQAFKTHEGDLLELVSRNAWNDIPWDTVAWNSLSIYRSTQLDQDMMENSPLGIPSKSCPMTLVQSIGTILGPKYGVSAFQIRSGIIKGKNLFIEDYSNDEVILLAQIALNLWMDALRRSRIPDECLQRIFGVKIPPGSSDQTDRHESQANISTLVWNAWCNLCQSQSVENDAVMGPKIVAAILNHNLPNIFRSWVEACSEISSAKVPKCPYSIELVKRGAWGQIPWDYEVLSGLRSKTSSTQPRQETSEPHAQHGAQGNRDTTMRKVVWLKIPKDSFRFRCGIEGALQEGIMVERQASWRKIMEFVGKNGWIQYQCELLEWFGEDILLFAEPCQGPHGKDRNNPPATYMCNDTEGWSHNTIHGKALLARRNGEDLERQTVERFVHFRMDMMDLRERYEDDKAGLTQAMTLARSNWPKFRVGDSLLDDGTLKQQECPHGADLSQELLIGEPAGGLPGSVIAATTRSSDARLSNESAGDADSEVSAEFVFLRFSRDPAKFHDLLQTDVDDDLMLQDLVACRKSLSDANMPFRLENGAYVFVTPDAYATVCAHFDGNNIHLRSGDVVVSPSLEASVMRAVLSLPRRHKISLETRSRVSEPIGASSAGDGPVYLVKRTFVHVMVPSSMRTEGSGGPRTVSDTQASLQEGSNPRSFVKRTGV